MLTSAKYSYSNFLKVWRESDQYYFKCNNLICVYCLPVRLKKMILFLFRYCFMPSLHWETSRQYKWKRLIVAYIFFASWFEVNFYHCLLCVWPNTRLVMLEIRLSLFITLYRRNYNFFTAIAIIVIDIRETGSHSFWSEIDNSLKIVYYFL